ncbi:MAG: PD40 domain-containing protein [Gemmatimonadaceae bacterium]|nr:PD40 domain-containing protein [Gemmatimonadaceae bacterium]
MLHHILYRYRGLSVACTIAAASMSCTDGSGPTGPDNSVTTVEVAAPSASLMVGETFQLAAVARNAASAFAVAGQVTWTSSNNSVATVSPNGLVTAVETGAAQISATHEGRTGSARVTVVTTELIQSIDQYADGTLAFTSTRGGAFDVFTAGPSGLTRVTANPDHEQFDGWSPDGSRLAFIRFPVNAGVFTSHVINSDGTNDIVVASGLVQWSPNWTKRNAFRDGQLVVTNADGSGAVVVSPPVGDTIFGGWWSPDGTRIAFGYAPSGSVLTDIYVVNADGTGLRNLTNSPNIAEDYADWSPDGTRLALTGHNYQNDVGSSLYVVGADDGTVTRFTSNDSDRDDLEPAWAPDGKLITFTLNRGVTFGIYVISASGGSPARLSPASMIAGFGKWSSDGARLAFTGILPGSFRQIVFVMTLDRTKIFQISARSSDNLRPLWKP